MLTHTTQKREIKMKPIIEKFVINRKAPLDFTGMHINDLRECVIQNLRFNNMDVTPDARKQINTICSSVIGETLCLDTELELGTDDEVSDEQKQKSKEVLNAFHSVWR